LRTFFSSIRVSRKSRLACRSNSEGVIGTMILLAVLISEHARLLPDIPAAESTTSHLYGLDCAVLNFKVRTGGRFSGRVVAHKAADCCLSMSSSATV